ncbi:chaperone modulator CbpM [Chamaesiphon sp. VAR_69_metabat_338]|uniref:chaperone modulator CbpM n=1 Tax=Chamaesiphon sp. VAR_69_metabat_338 TaxID=2964704 RepID=UPI00286D8C7D|nr:chaperone modulator CbpM [Chamaesiphon sp. VAR_69_metabat_338]
MTFSLSTTVVSTEGDCLYTFEYAANAAQTSIAVIHVYIKLGAIEPTGSMLHSREIARIAQIQRLRADLGVNLVGAAIVLDLAQEVAQLRAQLEVYRWRSLSER